MTARRTPSRDVIVIVHGLGSNPLVMTVLAQRLNTGEGRVINWGYRSLLKPIPSHGQELTSLLQQLDGDPAAGRLHLVTHSMGGIVARTALVERVPRKMGRMVMLAPPNRGSRAATFFGPLLQGVCRPIDQLADRPDSFVCTLPEPKGLEIGVIAANYDNLVREDSTRLKIQRDHLVIPTWHTGLLFRQDVSEQVLHFLQHGRFHRSTETTASA